MAMEGSRPEPELGVRWRNVEINAKGREAISAARVPVLIVLTARAAVAVLFALGIIGTAWWSKPYLNPLWDAVLRWWT